MCTVCHGWFAFPYGVNSKLCLVIVALPGAMNNRQWLGLPMAITNLHGPKDV